MSTRPALLVKVDVVWITGVARLSAPDLNSGAWIAREYGSGISLVVGAVDVIGLVERTVITVRQFDRLGIAWDAAVQQLVWRRDTLGLFDEMRIDEEKFDIALRESLLCTDAVEAGIRELFTGGWNGIVPEASGAVAALRRPDTAWMLADMAPMGCDGGADLRTNALIGSEQRIIAVGRTAGDDLDQTKVVEVTEASDDVAAQFVEIFERIGEETLPETGCGGVVLLACLKEECLVLACGDDLAFDIFGELSLEYRVCK